MLPKYCKTHAFVTSSRLLWVLQWALYSPPYRICLFAIPMLSSWSTSLNLVFFSTTWTTIAMTYAPLKIEFFAPLVVRLILYILPSAGFLR